LDVLLKKVASGAGMRRCRAALPLLLQLHDAKGRAAARRLCWVQSRVAAALCRRSLLRRCSPAPLPCAQRMPSSASSAIAAAGLRSFAALMK
jgi:hypothetical protein